MEIAGLEQEGSHALDLVAMQAPATVQAAGAPTQAVGLPSERDPCVSRNKRTSERLNK